MTDTTHYLYIIRPTRLPMLTDGPTPAEEEIVARHFAYLKELAERGVVVLAGRTIGQVDEDGVPNPYGIVIIQSHIEEYARAVMENDPAVKEGVMTAELSPFRLALLGNPAPPL